MKSRNLLCLAVLSMIVPPWTTNMFTSSGQVPEVVRMQGGTTGTTLQQEGISIWPNGLTMDANKTGGVFPDSLKLRNDGNILNISETCWTYTLSNNTTWCNRQAWRLNFWFEYNGIIPEFTSISLTFYGWKSGDNERISLKAMNWKTGQWFVTSIRLTTTPTLYSVQFMGDYRAQMYHSLWLGFVHYSLDSARTTVHIDQFEIKVTT